MKRDVNMFYKVVLYNKRFGELWEHTTKE